MFGMFGMFGPTVHATSAIVNGLSDSRRADSIMLAARDYSRPDSRSRRSVDYRQL